MSGEGRLSKHTTVIDNIFGRCPWCGWPLREDESSGCAFENCSLRPLPDLNQYGAACLAAQREKARAEALLAALRAVEWKGTGSDFGYTFPCCPLCGSPSPDVEILDAPEEGRVAQHMPDCAVGEALAKAEGR